MPNLHQLLKAMIEKGASDLHITTGAPPQLRIDGRLVPLKSPPLSAPESTCVWLLQASVEREASSPTGC